MKKLFKYLLLSSLFFLTVVVRTYHSGVFPKPKVRPNEKAFGGTWISKEKFGMNHMILKGTPYQRGLQSGRFTSSLLEKQEDELMFQLKNWISNPILLHGFVLGSILWFQGFDKYFEPWMLEEMYGVSKYSPKKYDYLVDGFTRQAAYHGLHEVGQMIVDKGPEGMGCTVVAFPWEGHWVLGRNFDFEGGRIFDNEKIVKWVFPDHGNAFVSIIWAGMVGAVTGVNNKGIYISINAGGSSDFSRVGTPTTLVLLKVLQEASTIDEAIKTLKEEKTFITDIFVILDQKNGQLYRIEKSPKKMAAILLREGNVITNHLIDPIWKDDSTNMFRRENLTSVFREDQGKKMLEGLKGKKLSSLEINNEILKILRNKGEANGKPLHLGNRRAIDALIATHAVIFNSAENILYVSQGPGVSGPMVGFDLEASFQKQYPVSTSILGRDEIVTDEMFNKIRISNKELILAQDLIHKKKCKEAKFFIDHSAELFKEQSIYYETLGDWYECNEELDMARQAWKKSLTLSPAYKQTVKALERKISK